MEQVLLAVAILGYASCDQLGYLPPPQPSPYSQYPAPSRLPDANSARAQQVPILRFENDDDGEGAYSYVVETGDGIRIEQQGDATGDGLRARGGFSYTAPDGQQIQVVYHADENGFQPQGEHLPTPPPVPEEIQRALERNLADEARGVVDDGQYRAQEAPAAARKAQRYDDPSAGSTAASASSSFASGRAQYASPASPPVASARSQAGYRY